MDVGLIESLNNLYQGNILLCQKQGVDRVACEKRIEETLKRIQGITKGVCKGDKDCEKDGMEWHIDNEEISKLRQRLLKTYT